jgi:hypothetical protein
MADQRVIVRTLTLERAIRTVIQEPSDSKEIALRAGGVRGPTDGAEELRK